jgi:hypothetical protein
MAKIATGDAAPPAVSRVGNAGRLCVIRIEALSGCRSQHFS